MDKDSAITSFVIGLLCWIPLLNWALSPLAVYFGAKAILNIRKDPSHYGGLAFAIIGTIIGVAVFFFNVTWYLFYGPNALFPFS